MLSKISLFLLPLLFSQACANAQVTAPSTYDVSTVRPSPADKKGMMLNWANAELKADNVTLQWIMTAAFHVRGDQISGLPGWALEQHFDISAKLLDLDPATLSKMTDEQHRTLLLALLTERFGLKYHAETKDMPVYDLVPSARGVKLTPAADSGDKTKKVYGMCSGCAQWGNHDVKAHDIPISGLTERLASQLERDVNDRTGFNGNIDVELKWAPDLGSASASDESTGLPPLAQALEQQLGLRLVSTRGPVRLIVVDHLEKPSEN